jgi:hypothetical protein
MKEQIRIIGELTKQLMAKFSNEPAPEPAKFETATLPDGTVIEWEGELMVGTPIFVVDGENRVPVFAGTHNIEDGRTIITDENGIVTEIVEVDLSKDPQPEQMSADKVNEIVNAKMSEVLDTFSKGFESITSAFESMSAEHKSLKEEFEAFKKLPSNPEKENQKFNRQGEDSNLTARQNLLLKNLKRK